HGCRSAASPVRTCGRNHSPTRADGDRPATWHRRRVAPSRDAWRNSGRFADRPDIRSIRSPIARPSPRSGPPIPAIEEEGSGPSGPSNEPRPATSPESDFPVRLARDPTPQRFLPAALVSVEDRTWRPLARHSLAASCRLSPVELLDPHNATLDVMVKLRRVLGTFLESLPVRQGLFEAVQAHGANCG